MTGGDGRGRWQGRVAGRGGRGRVWIALQGPIGGSAFANTLPGASPQEAELPY